MVGFPYTQGLQGGNLVANYKPHAQPQAPPPPRRPGPLDSATPIEDGDNYPSRSRILEGVGPRSSTGVSNSDGSRRPEARGSPRSPKDGGVRATRAGGFALPLVEDSRWGGVDKILWGLRPRAPTRQDVLHVYCSLFDTSLADSSSADSMAGTQSQRNRVHRNRSQRNRAQRTRSQRTRGQWTRVHRSRVNFCV